MPPTTTMASGRCVCAPIPPQTPAGNKPKSAVRARIHPGRDRPVGGVEEPLGASPGLVHGPAQVAAADAELDGDEALALFAVDLGRAGALERAAGVRCSVFAHRRDEVP